MSNSPHTQTMDIELQAELQQLYHLTGQPEYFAGGHEWSDGTIYQYRQDGEEFLVKLLPLNQPEQQKAVAERQHWMEYLNLNGVGTVFPLHSSQDNLVELISDGTALVYAWKKVQGAHITTSNLKNRQQLYPKWGALLGKIHRLTQAYPHWKHSAALDADKRPLISFQREYEHFYGWLQDDEVREAWKELHIYLETLPIARRNFGFVHNDAHPGNIIIQKSKLILLDFDVANYLWFMLDIAICIFSEFAHIKHHSNHKDQFPFMDELFVKPFMQGYESQNVLFDEEYNRIEVFIRYRRFIMFAAFYAQIKTNAPAYLEQMKRELIDGNRFFSDGKDFIARWR